MQIGTKFEIGTAVYFWLDNRIKFDTIKGVNVIVNSLEEVHISYSFLIRGKEVLICESMIALKKEDLLLRIAKSVGIEITINNNKKKALGTSPYTFQDPFDEV